MERAEILPTIPEHVGPLPTFSEKPFLAWGDDLEQAWFVAFSPDGEELVSVHQGYGAVLWDSTGGKIRTFEGEIEFSPEAAVSPGWDMVAATTLTSVLLWELSTGRRIRAFDRGGDAGVAFSPDGKTIAIGGEEIEIWNIPPLGGPLATLGGSSEYLAFSPNGETLAAVDWEKITLWNIDSLKVSLHLIPAQIRYATGLSFSPDGLFLAASVAEHESQVWNTETGEEIFAGTHDASVRGIGFSPDGRILASAGWDGKINLWSVPTRALIQELMDDNPANQFHAVAFSPDGKTLAATSWTNGIEFWRAAQ
ncbi:MAG: hypothetical protein GY856_09545 [bacterium]|nr:hypothetical protein [bacterium]